MATAPNLDGPYTPCDGPLNNGQITPTISEGPTVLPDPSGAGWLMLYDFPMANDYGASRSPNLRDWAAIPSEAFAFPPHARHGSAFLVSEAQWQALTKAFPVGHDKPYAEN